MEKENLIDFIAKAHRNTYAAPAEIQKQNRCAEAILPGHVDYEFIGGDFSYHDSYAGNTWAPGREVVFYQGAPVWAMAYQGHSHDNFDEKFFNEQAFPFLKKALMNFDDSLPFRGPTEFSEGDFEYVFTVQGDYQYFIGQERVYFKGEEIFMQDVMGSIIK
jgi:hypothetical protein